MSLRSLFAGLAFLWFVYLATSWMAPDTFMVAAPDVDVGDVYREVLGGSELGLAVTSAVRAVSIGFAVLSLAAIEWGALFAAYRESEARRRAAEEPAAEEPTTPAS